MVVCWPLHIFLWTVRQCDLCAGHAVGKFYQQALKHRLLKHRLAGNGREA